MKMLKQLLPLGCAASMLLCSTLPVFAREDTSYRQLLDYAIFNGSSS